MAAGILVLLAVFVYLSPMSYEREMGFCGGLHNSLVHLDQAKSKWAEEQHKSEGDIPTMAELAPYLGEWTNSVQRFVAAGIEFKISPFSEGQTQTDVATFTRDLSFQRGFCRFYRAGTSFGLYAGWKTPHGYTQSQRFWAIYHHYRPLLAAVIFLLAVTSIVLAVITNIRSSKSNP